MERAGLGQETLQQALERASQADNCLPVCKVAVSTGWSPKPSALSVQALLDSHASLGMPLPPGGAWVERVPGGNVQMRADWPSPQNSALSPSTCGLSSGCVPRTQAFWTAWPALEGLPGASTDSAGEKCMVGAKPGRGQTM